MDGSVVPAPVTAKSSRSTTVQLDCSALRFNDRRVHETQLARADPAACSGRCAIAAGLEH